MKLRWILSTLFIVAIGVGASLLFERISVSLANDKQSIGVVSHWLALIPTIFLSVLVVSVVLGILTLLSPPDRRRRWKTFWNVVEFVWIFGTGWSIFGLISTQLPRLQDELASTYNSVITELNPELSREASELMAQHCRPQPVDEQVCAVLGDLAAGDPIGKIWEGDAYWRFSLAVDRFVRLQPNSPAVAAVVEFRDGLLGLRGGKSMREQDLTPRRFPAWIRWLNIAAPLIFAFVFPLRIGRAVAAFGL
jgi:hypothetical protein